MGKVALISRYDPAKTIGGVERFTVDLHSGFHRRGIDAELVVSESKNPFYVATLPSINEFSIAIANQRGISNVPFITIMHASMYGYLQTYNKALDEPKANLRARLESLACRDSAAIVAVSERVKHELLEGYGADESKIKVISNGVDLERFRPRISYGSKLPLYVGRMELRTKGIDLLESAAERISVPILATGYNGKSLRILPIPHLPLERAHELYSQASALLLPSRYEGFGLAMLEAMASGVPVVAFDVGAARQLITDGQEGFVIPPGDVAKFSAAVNYILQDRDLREKMGINARRKAEQFSIDKMVDSYLGLINEVKRKVEVKS